MKLAVVGLVAAVGLAYGAHIRDAGYVYEDRRWVESFVSTRWNTRPLMTLSMLRARTYPQVHHALNLVLHASVVALLGLFAYRSGFSQIGAWFTASLFAVHPVNSQAAAYVAARPELFAALGVIGACLLAVGLHPTECPHCKQIQWGGMVCTTCGRVLRARRQSAWRWPLIVLAILFGLAGKETAVVALGLVPLVLWHTRQRSACIASVAGGMVGLAVAGWWVLSTLDGPAGLRALVNLGESSTWRTTWDTWVLTQSAASHRLFSLFLWPDALTVDPDLDMLSTAQKSLGLVTLALLGLVAFWQRHARPLVTFGLLWALISLAPRFVIQTPRSALNAHQFYTVSLGLTLAVGAWWDTWRQKATT